MGRILVSLALLSAAGCTGLVQRVPVREPLNVPEHLLTDIRASHPPTVWVAGCDTGAERALTRAEFIALNQYLKSLETRAEQSRAYLTPLAE